LAAVGATLVVAHDQSHHVRREQGDHKGRPYIFRYVGPNPLVKTGNDSCTAMVAYQVEAEFSKL
jgi:hypothetical protein